MYTEKGKLISSPSQKVNIIVFPSDQKAYKEVSLNSRAKG